MSRHVFFSLAALIGTACLGHSMSVTGVSVGVDTAEPQFDTGPPLGEDVSAQLTEVLVCGDLDLFIVDTERTLALQVSKTGAGAQAYEDGTTTTYSWKDAEGAIATLWVGTDLLPDPCTMGTIAAVFDVIQGSLELKISPSEIEPDADGYPIRATVTASFVGLVETAGQADDLWISELDVGWQGTVTP